MPAPFNYSQHPAGGVLGQGLTAPSLDTIRDLGFGHGLVRGKDFTSNYTDADQRKAYAEGYSRGLEFYGEENQCFYAPIG
jgi:hypothetical protein